MKKILLYIVLIITASCSQAQEPQETSLSTLPPLPDYRILTTDSTWATPAMLKKNVPIVIIYFSPDCSHCQRMMYELKPKLKELKDVQVVMITWTQNYDIRSIRIFKRDFGLNSQTNFTIGTEGYTLKVQNYYHIKTTPFIAMYDSRHKFVQSFDKVPKTEDILTGVKKLIKAG